MSVPRPASGAPRRFHFPNVQRSHLENGLEVVAVPMPGRTLCAAEMVSDAGAALNEIEGAAWLLARAFNEGTTTRDAAAFADACESIGMQLSAGTSWDTLSLSITVPRSRMAESLALMAEAAWTPGIPEDGFLRLKHERLVQVQQERANPAMRAALEFPLHAFTPDSTYARSLRGTAETVGSLTRGDIAGHHERFVSPGSSTLVVAGDLDPAWVFDEAQRAFGGFTRPESDRKAPAASSAVDQTRIVIVDRPGSVQSNLVVGHLGVERTHPDYDALRVANYVLGGSFLSRVNGRLREELGYTYGARSDFDPRRAPGPFQIAAPVQAGVTASAVREILSIAERFVAEGITDEETQAAQDYIAGVFPLRFETTDAVASSVAALSVYGLPDSDLTTFPDRIRAVTREKASEAARAHLRPNAMLVVVVGPAADIADELGSIAPVTVVAD